MDSSSKPPKERKYCSKLPTRGKSPYTFMDDQFLGDKSEGIEFLISMSSRVWAEVKAQ